MNLNTQIYDNVVHRSAMLRLFERKLNERMDVIIKDHESSLNARLSAADQKKLRSQAADEIMMLQARLQNEAKSSLLELVSQQINHTYSNISNAIGDIWRVDKPPKRINENIVLDTPIYNDKNLASCFSGISQGHKIRVDRLIREGISRGDSVNAIAKEITKSASLNITRNQTRALVVTGMTSVTAQADHQVYKANEKSLVGWQYVAVLDTHTTPLCASRDGHIYKMSETSMLPPAHFHCRSTTLPVFKSWADIAKLEGVANVRKQNIAKLTDKQKDFYDGQTPARESYNDWLFRQPQRVQMQHLGDYQKLKAFQSGQLKLSSFLNDSGNSVGLQELKQLTRIQYGTPNDTMRFANAKEQLDAMQLWATNPDDFLKDSVLKKTLVDYYKLQAGELDGTLSLTNYRGALIHNKQSTKTRVLSSPPTEEQMRFNPANGRYEDVRLYQPAPHVLEGKLRLLDASEDLTELDKAFIKDISDSLDGTLGVNHRAVVVDNLRTTFSRYRKNPAPWQSFKGVSQAQIKFDVMNVSDDIETSLRQGIDPLKKLLKDDYIDPVLGATQLQDLHDNFIKNIVSKNSWEDKVAPKIAKELHSVLNTELPLVIRQRLTDRELQQFYLRFAHRLSLADTPDVDQMAVALGRDLYNMAGLNGKRLDWYKTGMKIVESNRVKSFYQLETFGVQKRRMKSRNGGKYFGPYYDTIGYNIRITDPRIQEYAQLTRKVDLGLRVSVTTDKNRLEFREGYKTYFVDRGLLGKYDTRIPITSTSSFSDFPDEFVDKSLVEALNWASKAEYKIDPDYHNFIQKLLYFADDKGNAKLFDGLNEYKHYIVSRGDAYERFKAMDWLVKKDASFSNHPFIDHRARIYERGLIGPQAGETFRPFLNTKELVPLNREGFENLQDQIGAFLGGLDDHFEGRYNSLTILGRQKIAEKWRKDIITIGNQMRSAKPQDIRNILQNPIVQRIDGEELGKFYRFAIESAKIDEFLLGNYSPRSLERLKDYKIALGLEQDASSSGAQIIALTTRNKQLASLSNVIPTTQKRRLYDEIAAATFDDPRFKELNKVLGLTEKDLRKAAKAQNMVTFYGAGERTGIMNVEGKLAKVLDKADGTLVVKAGDRDVVLNEISARIARVEKYDPLAAEDLRALRANVKDIFNKGLPVGDDIMSELWFLDSKTQDLVEKMSLHYDRVVTPDDFKLIASIMSDHLRSQVPILKDFTRFFGRLAEDYLNTAKPSNSSFDWQTIIKSQIFGDRTKGASLPDWLNKLVGIKPGTPFDEEILKRFTGWNPNSNMADILKGVDAPEARRTGAKYLKTEIKVLNPSLGKMTLGENKTITEVSFLKSNKLPKSWTNVPWVNFDGKVIEQNFTQSFEERIWYKNKAGENITNIVQVPQRTEASWWDQAINSSGKINDIADATKARTAFAVNGNHSNDAVIVKKFHQWGSQNGVATSTIHDAFFANAGRMIQARQALRGIYADVLKKNVIAETLLEMKNRGLPEHLYNQYLNEAIDIGLIPVAGRSRVGDYVLKDSDILKADDILQKLPDGFKQDYGWYGIG